MTDRQAAPTMLSPQDIERLWAEHLKGEFESKDVEATLATMVDDVFMNHMPVNSGGRGKDALRVFCRVAKDVSGTIQHLAGKLG